MRLQKPAVLGLETLSDTQIRGISMSSTLEQYYEIDSHLPFHTVINKNVFQCPISVSLPSECF